MSIRIIYGRAGSGKTRYCLDEIKSRITSGVTHPLVLLVPEQFTYQAERDLITLLGTGGIIKTEVLSFRRMAYRIFHDVGGISFPHLHPAGKSIIVHKILSGMEGSLKVFSKSTDRQGFVKTLTALITEFKQYNINPFTLEKIMETMPGNSPLKDKLFDLYSVYAEYEKVISDKYMDSGDDLTLASLKLDSSSLYDGAEIWIDGFAGFTPQEYLIIEKLCQKARKISICLCTGNLDEEDNKSADAFSPVKRTYRKILLLASKTGTKVEGSVFLGEGTLHRFKGSPELAHLERNINAYPHETYREKTRDIILFASMNLFSEVESVARDIVRLCRDRGMRYREIAVVARNLADYERAVEAIFAEYGIPCFIDCKIDIAKNPLVKLIQSMLEIFNDNWSYEAVFRYLKTGLTGVERSDIDKLENYVLACGIRGRYWTNDRDWDMSPGLIPEQKDFKEAELKDINRIRYEVCRPLLEFREKTRGRKKASEICGALYDFLCLIGVPERIKSMIEHFENSGKLSLAGEYSQVWNIVMDLFDQIVEVMGDETLSIERFSNILKIGLDEYQVGLIPASLDQVLVGSIDRSRSHEVKALYILGVNDGIFPSALREEGILSDPERIALKNAGIELAGDTKTKAFDEQYLVYRALTTPGNYLWLSWPIADHEGRSMRPSMIISRLKKLFPAITEYSDITMPGEGEIEFVSGTNPAFKKMVAVLRQKADGKNVNPLWKEVYKWFAAHKQWHHKCSSLGRVLGYKNVAQPVSRDKTALLYGEPVYSSVSRLEKYAACPFAFYVQYGLGAKERKVYRLCPPDIGTFMHKVIEEFSRELAAQKIDWSELDWDQCESKVSEIVDQMLEKMKGSSLSGSKRYTALLLRLKRVVTRAVWLISEHFRRGNFIPVGYEVKFGEGGEFPPITIELESGKKAYLTGRIDRVDALKTGEGIYLRIVDYKSGSKDFKLSDIFYGLQLQLVAYLDAIWEDMAGSQTVLPGGIFYFTLDDPIVKTDGRNSVDDIEKSVMKELKMKGLLLADVKLIREMDKNLEGYSLIIPASINKGDVLGKSSSAASLEQFNSLRFYVRKLLKDLCEEISQGKVPIRPYKAKKYTSCKYCSFSAICQFDTARKENTFKPLYDLKDEDIWRLIKTGGIHE